MTLINYVQMIRIHPILILFILISMLTGTFVDLFIILMIVLIHEFGHYQMAVFFKWRIQSIILWVFGGVMKTDEHGQVAIKEEVLVTLAGPLQHVGIYVLVFLLSGFAGLYEPLLPEAIIQSILYYNTVILFFNLLPIWPLDGGKLLFSILSIHQPYQQAYHVTIALSMISCLLLLIVPILFQLFTLSSFLLCLFLLLENRQEWKYRYFVFIRFLLNRYEGHTPISRVQALYVPHEKRLMEVFEKFYRDKKHPIYVTFSEAERQLIDESDCLRSFFHEKNYEQTVGELVSEHTKPY